MGPMNTQSPFSWNGSGGPLSTNTGMAQPTGNAFSSLRPNMPPSLPGKRVNSESDIAPNEVPMDGSIALFLMNDLSCIIAKAWNSQGGIDTVRFVPEKPIQQPVTDKGFQEEIFARLDRIEKEVKKKPYFNKNRTQSQYQKKDGEQQ